MLAPANRSFQAGGDSLITVIPTAEGNKARAFRSVILAISFLSIGLNPELVIKMIATGLAVGIVIDAVVIRTLLVPALVTLLGRWNWWMPRVMARALLMEPGGTAPTSG